jgi:6-phospho-beta-glucosidase
MLKLALIGGGSSYTPEFIEGLLERYDRFPVNELWLLDIEEGEWKLNIIYELAKRMIAKSGKDIKLYKTLNRKEALKDADYVCTQFRVGLLDARIRNERLACNYGMIGQETNSITGMAKAMMTIPVILDICKDIEEVAKPSCKLINFTNPSGRVTESVIKHTNVPIIGLCNVPIGLKMGIAKKLDLGYDDFTMIATGMNHFFFAREVIGKDGKDYTQEAINKFLEKDEGSPANIHNVDFLESQIKYINAIPCGYHRYYFLEDEMFRHQQEEIRSGKGTRGEQVKEIEEKLFELYKDPNLDVKPKELEKRGGQYYSTVACETICSIHNDEGKEIVASVKNQHANGEPVLKGLPTNAAVEVTCKMTKDGPVPMEQKEIDKSLLGLLQLMKSFDEMVVEGSVTGNKGALLHALQIHPMTQSGKVMETILEEMIKINKDYLPQFN